VVVNALLNFPFDNDLSLASVLVLILLFEEILFSFSYILVNLLFKQSLSLSRLDEDSSCRLRLASLREV